MRAVRPAAAEMISREHVCFGVVRNFILDTEWTKPENYRDIIAEKGFDPFRFV
jgi:hypothetical protein